MAQNTLTVPVEVVRVNNPDLVAESSAGVTLYRISPQYTLHTMRGTVRTELTMGGVVERSNNTDLSAHRTHPSVSMLWEYSTPVSVLGFRASLDDASSRETEFAEFGRVTVDSTQRTGVIGLEWNRALTAGSSLQIDVSHGRVAYDSPLLVDYNETLASLVYGFETGPNATYTLTASAARLNPDGADSSASRGGLGIGYEVDVSARHTVNVSAGAVRTSFPQRRTYPVGALRLSYEGERLGYALSWSREVSASGSVAGYTRLENSDISLSYPLTPYTSLSLGAAHAKSLESAGDAGATTYARLRSELTQFWALTIGLEHRKAMRFEGPTARGHAVAVGLVYSHPDF